LNAPAVAPRFTEQRVVAIRRWTPALLSFRITRDPAFRFTAGHYARLGLGAAGTETIWRPFSMASASDDAQLEFFAVLVPQGPFSALLARLAEGDAILVERSAFGFLTLSQLAAGRDLWLVASGTGLGPYVSMLREDDAWQRFENLVVVHGVRHAAELAYRDEILALGDAHGSLPGHAALRYLPVVTREPAAGALPARIPQLLEDGRLEAAAGLAIDAESSRAMVCGNPDMAAAMRGLLTARGFRTARRGVPGQMAFENYW
jgi:ferredoxin/flavodoxin---NADP+ reductase